MTFKYNYFDHPEHQAEAKEYAKKWIANAFCTDAMTKEIKQEAVQKVKDLYEISSLKVPRDDHVIFASSPFVASAIASFAAAIIFLRSLTKKDFNNIVNDDGAKINPDVLKDIPPYEGENIMLKTIINATIALTDGKHRNSLQDYCYEQEKCLTEEEEQTWHRWWQMPLEKIREAAKYLKIDEFGIRCYKLSYNLYAGANQHSANCCDISFFKDVVKRDIPEFPVDYTNYLSYEWLAKNSSCRYMHAAFTIVVDRAKVITTDENHRPHADEGAFQVWRDGTKYFSIRGVRVPSWVVTHPNLITWQSIDNEKNAEVRRIMLSKFGLERYITESGAEVISSDIDKFGRPRQVLRKIMEDDEDVVVVTYHNCSPEPDGSYKLYMSRIHPECRPFHPELPLKEPQELTPHNAIASGYYCYGHEYNPEVET